MKSNKIFPERFLLIFLKIYTFPVYCTETGVYRTSKFSSILWKKEDLGVGRKG